MSKGEPQKLKINVYISIKISKAYRKKLVSQISPYLIDAPSVIIDNRAKPLCNVSPMVYGNKPVDGGHLLLTTEEKSELIRKEPQAVPWLRPLLGAEEFINGLERWCLWLVGIKPHELRAMPEVLKRVAAVKEFRLRSPKLQTIDLANSPTLFAENRQPLSGALHPCAKGIIRASGICPHGFFR